MLDEKDMQMISAEIDSKLSAQKTEILAEMDVRMDSKLAAQKTEILSEIDAKMEAQKTEILSESAHNMRVILESYLEPKLKALAEGHELLLQTMAPKSRVENLEEEVTFLRRVVSSLSEDVAQLKKAQ